LSVDKQIILRFLTRKSERRGISREIVYFYNSSWGKMFHALCERGVISSFLERVGAKVRKSRTGKTLYLDGSSSEDIARRLIILAANRQCVKEASRIPDLANALTNISELEAVFWYSRIIDEYERNGYWGVCRVARAFRVIYRIN